MMPKAIIVRSPPTNDFIWPILYACESREDMLPLIYAKILAEKLERFGHIFGTFGIFASNDATGPKRVALDYRS